VVVKRPIAIPTDRNDVMLSVDGREVRLTNLRKVFWPDLGLTKGDLLRYYAAVADVLLPHLHDRAMVMKRYPHGAAGAFFFMKRAPSPRPDWIQICAIDHGSSNVIDFPMIQDRASLLWVINLGCIDLNQWYARCDDVDRPDYLHFDLDPGAGADFARVRETGLVLREALDVLKMPSFVKTTGSKGLHVYVPIVRGPVQKDVWTFAKALAQALAERHPELITAEYRIANRPPRRVLVDYNQNAWGRTLASIYSVRPTAAATVSVPVTWREVENGIEIGDFTLANVSTRIDRQGDLWNALLRTRGRVKLEKYLGS
jgi:bifunctional non-homologous end joining protein LigD